MNIEKYLSKFRCYKYQQPYTHTTFIRTISHIFKFAKWKFPLFIRQTTISRNKTNRAARFEKIFKYAKSASKQLFKEECK